tara:strand:- start:1312 stop:2010 length:699 start_codon:yes stop_codon:yes gene_type:complete
MKIIRNLLRKIKYKLKFIGKKDELSFYLSSFKIDNNLTNLMNKYGSDKGGLNNHHNYSLFYSEIFGTKRYSIKNFLEIGLGTNNINVPSNMGENGKPLASLRAWRDYFPNAKIFGADIDKNILEDGERIKTSFVDQRDPETISKMFEIFGIDQFDIIIEDGLHEFNANICFFENSVKHLSNEGIYIIEDVFYKDIKKFKKYFDNTQYNYSIIELYHSKNIANNCLIKITKNG